jgi:hypothetical protein
MSFKKKHVQHVHESVFKEFFFGFGQYLNGAHSLYMGLITTCKVNVTKHLVTSGNIVCHLL